MKMTQVLFPIADHVVVTGVDNPRSAPPEEVAEAALRSGTEVVAAKNFAEAMEKALQLTPKKGVLVITGSIYLVGEALGWLESNQQ